MPAWNRGQKLLNSVETPQHQVVLSWTLIIADLWGVHHDKEERIERQCLGNYIPWLQNWIDRSRDPTSPLRVHMIKFEDIVHDLGGTTRRIARILRDEFPAMAAYAECVDIEEVKIHFAQGDDDAWRSEGGRRDETKALGCLHGGCQGAVASHPLVAPTNCKMRRYRMVCVLLSICPMRLQPASPQAPSLAS